MNNHKNTLNNHAITITLAVSVSLQSLGFVLNPEEASNTTASNAYIFAIDQLRRGIDTGRFTTTLRETGPQYQSSSSFTGVSALSGSVTTTGPYTLTTPPQSNAQISSLTEFEKLFVPGNTATFIVTVIVVILIGFILLTSGYISFRFIMKSKNNDEDEGGRGSAIWNFFHFITKSKKIDKDGGGGGSAIGAAVSVSDARVCMQCMHEICVYVMYVHVQYVIYRFLYISICMCTVGMYSHTCIYVYVCVMLNVILFIYVYLDLYVQIFIE
jgi:hypothetical protein